MDSSQSFNSDSTFYNINDNSAKGSLKVKYKTSKTFSRTNSSNDSSQFLNKVHNEVLCHLEGKRLIGRVQVHQYMKKISKMKLKSTRDQYFAEKIQSALLKIFNLIKQFEKTSSLSQMSVESDPLENYTFTDEFHETNDPKRMLVRSNSITFASNSFPLELLTNNNFMSSTSQKSDFSGHSLVNVSDSRILCENQVNKETVNNKFDSLELFSSESSDIYLRHYPGNSNNEESNLFKNPDNVLCSKRKYVTTTTVKNDSQDVVSFQNNENESDETNIICKSISVGKNKLLIKDAVGFRNASGVKENTVTTDVISNMDNNLEPNNSNCYGVSEKICKIKQGVNERSVVKEFNNIVSKLMKNGESYSTQNHSNTGTEISETFYEDQSENLNVNLVKKVDLKSVKELGDFLDEVYNKKINKLCYGLGKEQENKTWQEIHVQLEHDENLSRNAYHTLDKLFENLSLEEVERNERVYRQKLNTNGKFHGFSEADEKKIDWESLFRKNEEKLEDLSKEFEAYLEQSGTKTNDIDDDAFDGLDWTKLLK